jgi:hypothetical protein
MALDPTKHVNYVEGMVLGTADLQQEFAYVSHRDQWIARELAGYGTVWGLQISQRIGTRGPEIVVASGVAVNPRGQFVRVAPAQCAPLNDWLAARTSDVNLRRQPTGDPNVFSLALHVVLAYRTCESDPVPIAGEPCRTEQDSLAPSRIGDDFLLELAFDPPAQLEEDAEREFVHWLRGHIAVTAGGVASHTIPQFLDAIRAAVSAAAAMVTSPPGAAPRLADSSPPMTASLPAGLVPDYLRAAMRLWVTELRGAWRPSWLGDKHGWTGDEPLASADQGNRLRLAAVALLIVPPGLNSTAWTVASTGSAITITDDTRPFLLHVRFLQEWLIAQGMGLVGGAAAGPVTIAAGVINGNGTPTARSTLNGLRVQSTASTATGTQLTLSFGGYTAPPTLGGPQYVVKVLPWPGAPLQNLTVTFAGFQLGGLVLAVSKNGAALTTAELDALQLLVEVSQYA